MREMVIGWVYRYTSMQYDSVSLYPVLQSRCLFNND